MSTEIMVSSISIQFPDSLELPPELKGHPSLFDREGWNTGTLNDHPISALRHFDPPVPMEWVLKTLPEAAEIIVHITTHNTLRPPENVAELETKFGCDVLGDGVRFDSPRRPEAVRRLVACL